MLHQEYLDHIERHVGELSNDLLFEKKLNSFEKEISIIKSIDLDPVTPIVDSLYSPAKLKNAKNPVCMLRSLILMTIFRYRSITKWVNFTRTEPIVAIVAGFESTDDMPGIGTYYDFMKRIIDGPYQKPCHCKGTVKRSEYNARRHERHLEKEKQASQNDFDPNNSQSAILAKKLLANAQAPRPKDLYQILEDLNIQLGVIPNIKAELISDLQNLVLSGDGSILDSASSGNGRPTCNCREKGIYKCDHARFYTSPTAKWCYDHHKGCFIFGDRYYHLITTQNGHDFPLLTHMPGGTESDYTLSLTSFDRFLKAARENGIEISVTAFIGDGHHDAQAHYQYFGEKGVLPIIPLCANTQKAYPHLFDEQGIRLDLDGTPLCPANKRMRWHFYDKKKKKHVYNCPAKRNTHRDGKSIYIFHQNECPNHQDCDPESKLGPFVYIKSSKNPRLFPPLPRSSPKFKGLMNQRSASERCNFINDAYGLEGTCRNADYGLIRLTLANIAHHALVRYKAAVQKLHMNESQVHALESAPSELAIHNHLNSS